MRNRVISSCVIGVLLLLAAKFAWAIGIWMILLALAALAQAEFYAMIKRAGIPVFDLLGVACGSLLISVTFFTIGPSAERALYALRCEQFLLPAILATVFLRQFPQKHNDRPLATIGCTLLGIWYVPFFLNFMTRLAFSWEPMQLAAAGSDTGRRLCLYLIVVVKFSDIGAFLVGKRFGRHRLFPRISPGKTWEGLVGGFVASLAASALFYASTGGNMGRLTMRGVDALVLGVLLPLSGVAGDMFESLIKRATGTKDSSSLIPGMGGMLDVLDSLLFGTPLMYFYARFFLS